MIDNKMVQVSTHSDKHVEEVLAQHGKDGYELVAVLQAGFGPAFKGKDNIVTLFFKKVSHNLEVR